MAVSGHYLGGQLCKVLGLKECVSFSLHCDIEGTAYIEAKLLAPDDSADGITEVIKRYELVESTPPEEDDEPGGDIDWGDGGPLGAS